MRESDADANQAGMASPTAASDLLAEHIVSPAPTTERLQSIQRMLADQLGDALPPDFSASVLQSIPVPVMGGIMMLLFGSVASVGLKTLIHARVDMDSGEVTFVDALSRPMTDQLPPWMRDES